MIKFFDCMEKICKNNRDLCKSKVQEDSIRLHCNNTYVNDDASALRLNWSQQQYLGLSSH